MTKRIPHILLGIAALSTNVTTNAMEWREVAKMDFGGNDESADAICNTKPNSAEIGTDLEWIGQNEMVVPGKYIIIKATELADVGKGCNLTNWGDFYTGMPRWVKGGDHTFSDNTRKGYYMAVDCTPNVNRLKLYKKVLPVSCAGVELKFEAYLAALNGKDVAANTVSVSIVGGGKTLASQELDLKTPTTGEISWEKLSTTFKVDDPNITSVDFLVESLNNMSSGWDIALDDITISVSQPTIEITPDNFFYKEPATLKVSYNQDEFDAFFGNIYSNVVYKWYKYNESNNDFEEISGAGGNYSSGKDISYTIASFEKDLHNGTYRLIVSTNDNFGNNLCSIQKEYEVKEDVNKIYVVMCKDSTLTTEFGDVLSTVVADDQIVDFEDREYIIKYIRYIPLETKYDMQCKNSDYPTVGDFKLDDIIEREPRTGCPTSIQKHYLRVVDDVIMKEPKHVCEGDKYTTDDNVEKIYTEVNEIEGDSIAFDYDGCRYSQYVFVHPKYEVEENVTVCKGDSYDGVPYNKVGIYKGSNIILKTIWGCDSIYTPKITVVEPVEVTKEAVVCPSDNYEFDSKVYNYPIDTTITVMCKGCANNGCDSTTILHLNVAERAEVHLDTLICKEQILFGDTFMVAGTFQKKTTGFTESGCPIDTIWNIDVVDVNVRLRIFASETEAKPGDEVTLNATINTYDAKGRTLTPTYHWEPEMPSNVLSPTFTVEKTTTYTIFADLDLPSDVDRDAKGCHAKESITISVNSNAVDDILADPSSKENVYYNMKGQKVDHPERGTVYINNGKKIMYK
ncbi:MAG: hypothetical protein IKQ08_06910 [Paludibacteraceae bacterium]|nr:hypothetical protein [Paludibacteraceae bacterium]